MTVRIRQTSRLPALVAALAVMPLMVACGSGPDSDSDPASDSASTAAGGAAFSPQDLMAALGSPQSFDVDLSGVQVVPAADSRNTGRARISVDLDTNALVGVLNTSIVSPTAAHLHEGGVGEVGAILVTLEPQLNGTDQFIVPQGTVLTEQQALRLRAGATYIDVHSGQFPDGEIRAQLSEDEVPVAVAARLDTLQSTIFTPVCSGCHTGGGQTLPGILNLTSADASYASLVGVYSIGEPEFLRVDSQDAEASLLVRKLEGTQVVGARMPFRGARLADEQIQAVRDWIDAGALR